jgi:PhnB protein
VKECGEVSMSEAGVRKIAVAPFLSVRNGAAAIEFYKAAFGIEVLFRHDGLAGAVVCETSVGQGRFWLSDESPENKNFSPETLAGATAWIVIELDVRMRCTSGDG